MAIGGGGVYHPDHLLKVLTSTQLKEWEMHYENEPWGEAQQFYQTGIIASTIVNWSGKSLKKNVEVSPKDFMPYYKEVKVKQTADQMKHILKQTLRKAKKKKKKS